MDGLGGRPHWGKMHFQTARVARAALPGVGAVPGRAAAARSGRHDSATSSPIGCWARRRLRPCRRIPRKLINEGENVVLDLKPHWFFFWKHIVAGAVFLVVFVLWARAGRRGELGGGWPLGIGAAGLRRVRRREVPRLDVHPLRAHGPAGHLAVGDHLEARHRDPARADQQHRLPPEHPAARASAPATSTSSPRARTGRATSTTCATRTWSSRRSTGRWRRTRSARPPGPARPRPRPGSARRRRSRSTTRPTSPSRSASSRRCATRATSRPAEYEAKKAELLERM